MYPANIIVVSALGVASVLSTWKVTRNMQHWYDDFQEDLFHKHSVCVEATIISLQEQRAWKEQPCLPSWRILAHKRAWGSSYSIIAEWTSPHTHTTYTFHFIQHKDE